MTSKLDTLKCPPRVRNALARLVEATEPGAPGASLVVYGSLAKGGFREGESDVNLAVVLEKADGKTLFALAKPFRAAERDVKLEPFVLERREIPRLADAFPVKLADIRAAHHVILGADPFADLAIDPEHLRLRVEQELRNHLVRLRRHALDAATDELGLARAIYRSATSLGIELGALLDVAGKPRPAEHTPAALARAAAEAFDLDRDVLAKLEAVRRGAVVEDARALYAGLLRVLGAAVEIADRTEKR